MAYQAEELTAEGRDRRVRLAFLRDGLFYLPTFHIYNIKVKLVWFMLTRKEEEKKKKRKKRKNKRPMGLDALLQNQLGHPHILSFCHKGSKLSLFAP